MSVRFEYKIDGRRVTKQQWERHMVHDAPRELAVNALQDKVAGLRCNVHGQAPKLSLGGDRPAGFEMKIDACCDALLERAQKKLEA